MPFDTPHPSRYRIAARLADPVAPARAGAA
ncbi:hypothetical protein S2M10_09110 [Sphingomonas sp. S2M10]|nr:hypothetical protein [Sphingomonas sp. S2M10]